MTGWKQLAWVVAFLALLAWQGYLTLRLFGSDLALNALLDERPVLSGSHPQHQYLGHLGSLSLRDRGQLCVYDPSFQAGYPKTPIFNSSRLAEMFLYFAGGGYRPAAYKIGIALVCLLVPVLIALAALTMRIGVAAAWIATLVGMVLWWGPHGRSVLEVGDLEVILASLAVLAHIGLLVRFHESPGVIGWAGLVLTGALGWFLQPMLFPIALPLLLIYYLCVGIRHESITWHLTLAVAELLALGVNLPWLLDWFSFWWLRAPLPLAEDMLRHRTLQTFWDAQIWGGPLERSLAAVLLLGGIAGCLILHRLQKRPQSRVLFVGMAGLTTLALLGISWEPLGELGTAGLLLPALWFACLPSAYFLIWGLRKMARAGTVGPLLAAMPVCAFLVLFGLDEEMTERMTGRSFAAPGLGLELAEKRVELIEALKTHTSPEARVLWEDLPRGRHCSRWPALLPIWTERSFIGGFDAEGMIEHSMIGLRDGKLTGKHLDLWTPSELVDYCKRYNVGWIVCWSAQSIEALNKWDQAEKTVELHGDVPGCLFAVKCCPRTFALKGKAQFDQADSGHIALSNLEPEHGSIVLSLHYQTGMRATPSRVQIERETCGKDPIGFVRLKVAGPVARVTLSWKH